MKRVLIVGCGFAGLNAAKALGGARDVEVTVVDRRNHHLFQPLLYQVAMAELSPAEIAAPIRSILASHDNIRVLLGEVESIDLERHSARLDIGEFAFDYLILACGASHSYFGHPEWEEFAPGLKSIEQATEMRRRVLTAFEQAERASDPDERQRNLTFVIVGGGPTGVELAGAIGEMSRFTLAKDFHNIDARAARILLIEAGPRILPAFSEKSANRAMQDLAELGVETHTGRSVTSIDGTGVQIGNERLPAATVLCAAGVRASPLARGTGLPVDPQGRVLVESDLSVKGQPNVFIAGDLARFVHQTGNPLPGTAPVAMQQGRYIGRTIRRDLQGKARTPFRFFDKGQMATIGRSKAVVEIGKKQFGGFAAWVTWLTVHIYYLTGFEHRLLVVLQWAWAYLTFGRGARLIVGKEWRQEKLQ